MVQQQHGPGTCMVTDRSSILTSFVRKSAPIVALYWLENFFVTNWFMRDVLPTLRGATQNEAGSPFWRRLNLGKAKARGVGE